MFNAKDYANKFQIFFYFYSLLTPFISWVFWLKKINHSSISYIGHRNQSIGSKLSRWVKRNLWPETSHVWIHHSQNSLLEIVHFALVLQHLDYVVLFLLSACRTYCALVYWHFLYHFSCWPAWNLLLQSPDSLLSLAQLLSKVSYFIFQSVHFSAVDLCWAWVHIGTALVIGSFLNSALCCCQVSFEPIVFTTNLIDDFVGFF